MPFFPLLNFTGGLNNFHEEPLGIITTDASSRNAGQDSGIKLLSILFFSKPD
jgi:hypothetical protein